MKAEFKLVTVTEAFVGGADARALDVKAVSILEPMRFWFRAMMGSVIGNDLARLRALESLAFGSTDTGKPFTVRLTVHGRGVTLPAEIEAAVGYSYLAFSVKSRPCLPVGAAFDLQFVFHTCDPLIRRVVLGSLWLLLHFGGIGARTHRTFGSLAALQAPDDVPASFTVPAAAVASHYKGGIEAIGREFVEFAGAHGGLPSSLTQPAFTSFNRWSGRIIFHADWQSVFILQDEMGRLLRGFRNGTIAAQTPWLLNPIRGSSDWFERTTDYKLTVAPFLDGNKRASSLPNAVLGLPLVVQSSSRRRRGARPDQARTLWDSPGRENQDRRASPLVIRPIRVDDGSYRALLAVFSAPFLPEKSKLVMTAGRANEMRVKPHPDQAAVDALAASIMACVDRVFGTDGEVIA